MSDEIKSRLELIAAKAKTMAADLSRYWPGDLQAGADELTRECHKLNEDIARGKRQ